MATPAPPLSGLQSPFSFAHEVAPDQPRDAILGEAFDQAAGRSSPALPEQGQARREGDPELKPTVEHKDLQTLQPSGRATEEQEDTQELGR